MSDGDKKPLTVEEVLAKFNVKAAPTPNGFVAKKEKKSSE